MNTLLILAGSQRPDGFNHALARAAEALLAPGWRAVTFDALALLPHLREDLDEPGQDTTLDRFRDEVRRSDAILFVTPEYNGRPPSLIKNALDHASRPRRDAPIAGKPAAVIGATPTAGARPPRPDAAPSPRSPPPTSCPTPPNLPSWSPSARCGPASPSGPGRERGRRPRSGSTAARCGRRRLDLSPVDAGSITHLARTAVPAGGSP